VVRGARTARHRADRFVQAPALRPEGQRRVALQPEVRRRQAERQVSSMALGSVQPASPCQLARPVVPAAVRRPARPSVAAAPKVLLRGELRGELKGRAQRLAAPMRGLRPPGWAEAAAVAVQEEAVPRAVAARPTAAPGVLAGRAAAAAPQRVAASVAAGLPPEEPAVQGAAVAEPQPVAVRVAAGAALLPAAVPAAEVLRRAAEAVPVAGVLRRAARGAQGEPLSAAAWAAVPLSIRLPEGRPAPSPSARSAHARKLSRMAQPKAP
jgi:hypothetical protein